ncbi:apoptosis regulatory protein Siva isoform X2 [Sceloporus undulatus]|uniref:apoptosis regulatory protein Siva isoform X2 n=1 Tax=Sceloporus undulatus TaxID=8520 RepID=UPI001C4C83D3|nr:apoptosis regulatory protein Siva isoform X2 [Sceloporus undulatus]
MPKRSCPFGDSAPLQLKTRVRLRELSQGVLGEQYRREIFEKTKQLLFRGAQTYMENSCIGSTAGECLKAQLPEPPADRPEACSQHRCNGQMLIGQDGKLRQPSAREADLMMLENESFVTTVPCSRNKMLETLRTVSSGTANNFYS